MAHIVLLEPDILLSQTYVAVLQEAGYTVAAAFDAQGALDEADERMPDLVILELQLPEHNGIEFLYEFRSYSEWQHVPVLVQSLTPPGEFRDQPALWEDLGVVEYLYKPRTSLSKLLASVSAQLLLAA